MSTPPAQRKLAHGKPLAEATGGQILQWEAFLNSTFNGTYWAIRRRNRRVMGGIDVMMTRGGIPRRFGSEGSAQGAADAANRDGWPSANDCLLKSERALLGSYLADVCRGTGLDREKADAFIERVQGMELDGWVDATELRTAKQLRARRYFASFRERVGAKKMRRLAVSFNAAGAGALFGELKRMHATDEFVREEVARIVDESESPVDAYKVARRSGLVDVMQACRGLIAMEEAGRATRVQGDGGNSCAWTYEAALPSIDIAHAQARGSG